MGIICLACIISATILELKGKNPTNQVLPAVLFGIPAFF
jgi:uncharacterized protein (UPF0297 family)